MASPALKIIAGATALAQLRERGFEPDAFRVMLGASGGAKWLVLRHLDREIARRVVAPRTQPMFLLGSSIGSWRFCCHAQPDPEAALERFEAAYLDQRYTRRPTPEEVSDVSRGILRAILGPGGASQVLSHPTLRLCAVAARARHLAASGSLAVQRGALLLAAAANAVSRRALGWFFERTVFHDPRDALPLAFPSTLTTRRVALTPENLEDAVMASASIPGVLDGVTGIPGAPPGVYRDGGVVDYHFGYPVSGEGLVLYPHFYPYVVPGWFDKRLSWRRAGPETLDRVVILCPSEEFVAALPGGRIPDRRDFWDLDNDERLARWKASLEASRRLADEFAEALETGRIGQRAEPFGKR